MMNKILGSKQLAMSLIFSVALVYSPIYAQDREMVIPVPQSAYSQGVKVRGGTLVFLSGVGPTDEKRTAGRARRLSRPGARYLGAHAANHG